MSSNVSKNETEEQESDSYQYEQDQECDGDEVFAVVKGKGKGGFKATCFNCGMRGHKEDRCWQNEQGKEARRLEKGKGNPKEGDGPKKNGQTWVTVQFLVQYIGTEKYGLEMDPWSAVEPVPYRCAVSLNSGCEEFSEPKRMSRVTHIKTSPSGSPRNFARVNKFSILSPDDNESPRECCASKNTSRKQCQQRRCGDERVDDALQPLRQKFPVTEDPVHRCWRLIEFRTWRRRQ